ncbi:fungal hydrophobin [Trametes versicolor FP-101664 SS1]|uniref:fungal hydrophobin n=1 Tax=Trametes versicolor (strain FP-101664) TaxID=717944 RepID=UPI0004623595|nr:fungal hydrophobin [Trametes versicolor FP-101664 SS1]EIW52216.1 fungal hydrophobin [Trametes versicolor FP-101664 SS1]
MMSRLFTLSALAILATASPMPNTPAPQSCSTGPIQCCNQVTSASSSLASVLLGALGLVVQDLNLPVGIACAPITGIGLGSGSACSAITVCCEDNSVGSLISIGCIPIIL